MSNCKWLLQSTVMEPNGAMGANMIEIAYLWCEIHGEVKRTIVRGTSKYMV